MSTSLSFEICIRMGYIMDVRVGEGEEEWLDGSRMNLSFSMKIKSKWHWLHFMAACPTGQQASLRLNRSVQLGYDE